MRPRRRSSSASNNSDVPTANPASRALILTSYLSDVINKNAAHPYAAALLAAWHLNDEFQAYLASVPRGPITHKSPYIPENASLVIYRFDTNEEYNRIRGYWKHYIPQ